MKPFPIRVVGFYPMSCSREQRRLDLQEEFEREDILLLAGTGTRAMKGSEVARTKPMKGGLWLAAASISNDGMSTTMTDRADDVVSAAVWNAADGSAGGTSSGSGANASNMYYAEWDGRSWPVYSINGSSNMYIAAEDKHRQRGGKQHNEDMEEEERRQWA
eukprot:TRINITY_DN16798_c1_g1_i1.p1 TRINITY_DN16798_c1_g1~~TRINITY_DN16798_c1_g1_i1.p1  ORF type:complete len:161 (-),score=41.42 TRINITY_DN16798_c1_g1_i1:201-683(-)